MAGPAHPRAPATRASQPAAGLDRPAPSGPRSSNRRVRGEFTDRDRHAFLTESFEYIARYFENSLSELQARNDQVEIDFRRIDANRFEARAFNGAADGGYNESMSVSVDGYALFLEPLGMARFSTSERTQRLPWRALPSISGTSSSNGSDSLD